MDLCLKAPWFLNPTLASDCSNVIGTYSSWRSNCSTLRAVNLNSNLFNTEDGLRPICRKAVQKSQKKNIFTALVLLHISLGVMTTF